MAAIIDPDTEILQLTQSVDGLDENTPLRGDSEHNKQSFVSKVKSIIKSRSRRCCLWSSKAALLILTWNLIVSFSLMSFFDPNLYSIAISSSVFVNGICYGVSSFFLLFYPLAGYLADVKWGRNKTVVNSLCFVFWYPIMLAMAGGLAFINFVPVIAFADHVSDDTSTEMAILASVVTSVVFGISAFLGLLLFLSSLIAFNANVIQYGMDQLYDAPTDDSVLYIHWYVWTTFVGSVLIRLPSALSSSKYNPDFDYGFVYAFSPLYVPVALIFLGITLCLQRYRHHWFLIESGFKNPYRLVYKVIKFASEHKDPIRRSAFTYCEDDLPSRLDLGKEKYGGPFTTEQVENVKAFVGILSVLWTIGPTFVADIALNQIVAEPYDMYFFYNITTGTFDQCKINFYHSGIVTPLMIVVLIPVNLLLLRPYIHSYIPGMLKRIGIGLILLMISVLCTLLMGSLEYHRSSYGNCFEYTPLANYIVNIRPNFLLIQFSLNSIGYSLLYISTYEFICAQSPHSMKGFIIGMFFAIRGFFQSLGVFAIYVPINSFCHEGDYFLCGVIYYTLMIVMLLIGIIAYAITARKYQYRERDEPDNIYRYAEEFYANAQDESSYDDGDYDNLNVETINNN